MKKYIYIILVLFISLICIGYVLSLINPLEVFTILGNFEYEIDTLDYNSDGSLDSVVVCNNANKLLVINSNGTNPNNISVTDTAFDCSLSTFTNSTNTYKKNVFIVGTNMLSVYDAVTNVNICNSTINSAISGGFGDSHLLDTDGDGNITDILFNDFGEVYSYGELCNQNFNKTLGVYGGKLDIGDLDGDGVIREYIMLLGSVEANLDNLTFNNITNTVFSVNHGKNSDGFIGVASHNVTGSSLEEILVAYRYTEGSFNYVNATLYNFNGTALWDVNLHKDVSYFPTYGSVIEGDLDGDGIIDDFAVAFGDTGTPDYIEVYALYKNGTIIWSNVTNYRDNVIDIVYGDLNNDNEGELILSTSNDNQNILIFNGSNGHIITTLNTKGNNDVGSVTTSGNSMIIADLNQNNNNELILTVLGTSVESYESDVIKPSINITSPLNGTNLTTTSTIINYTYLESYVGSCWYSINNGVTNSSSSVCGNNFSVSLSQGVNYLVTYINDTSNNYNKSNTINVFVDTISPSINILSPTESESFNFNHSIPLNYSITDSFAISSCWFSMDDGINTSLTSCTNSTFNTTDGSHTLRLYANDSLNNIGESVRSFSVSLDAPATTLNAPYNYQNISNGSTTYFNFTSIDANGLSSCELWGNWTGTWHKNFTWSNPTSLVMNSTIVPLFNDITAHWNVFCNDTLNKGNFSLTNFTFTIDSTKPSISINSIQTSAGSQTFNATYSVTEPHKDACWYTVRNESGGVDPATSENTTITNCTTTFSETVSIFGSYNLTIYVNDSAGNQNYTQSEFTLSQVSGGSSGGGGGAPLISTLVETVALIQPDNDLEVYSDLDRAKLYKAISDFCVKKVTFFSFTDSCFISEEQSINFVSFLKTNYSMEFNPKISQSWINQYNDNKIDNVKIPLEDIQRFNLITAIVTISSGDFIISPRRVSDFYFIIGNNPFKKIVNSNKLLSDVKVIEGDLGLMINSTSPTTTLLSYTLPTSPPDFTTRVIKGKINYIDQEGNSVFQDIQIRAIYLLSPTIMGVTITSIIILSYLLMRSRSRRIPKRLKGVYNFVTK